MKILPFHLECADNICKASSDQFLYMQVGCLKKLTFFGKVPSRRVIRTLLKEITSVVT